MAQGFGLFHVPQFIDIEPKIIGPITIRQFVLMMIAGMIDFVLYKLLDILYFGIFGGILTVVLLVFAFVRINGMPFHNFFLNLLQTLRRPNLRIWKKVEITYLPEKEKKKEEKEVELKKPIPKSKLSELTLVVNTGGAYQEEEDTNT